MQTNILYKSADNPESTSTNTSNGNPKPDTVTLPIMSVGKTSRKYVEFVKLKIKNSQSCQRKPDLPHL